MKIAYLAPELPALSATFVYNEILELEKKGTVVVPFSVHRPSGQIAEPSVQNLKQRVTYLYERSIFNVLKSHFRLLKRFPKRYISVVWTLFQDMFTLLINGQARTAIGLGYRFLYAVPMADELLKHHCNHIHVHFAHIPTDIAMYAAGLSGIGFSVTSHANDLFERGWLLSEKVSRSCFFGTISEFNKHFLIQNGADGNKIEVTRCGVDASQFSTRQDHVVSEPVKVGLVGRLVEKKGVDILLKALAVLRQQGRNIRVLIAGSGPLSSDLKKQAFDLGLDEQAVVFLGSIPHKEVANFIENLDIFVLPCKQDSQGDMDGIPVVLMEAMLSGVPVISTRLSGIPELVINGETGLLVEPSDSDGLVSAINQMIDDTELRESMLVSSVEKVRSTFSLAENVDKLSQLFQMHAVRLRN